MSKLPLFPLLAPWAAERQQQFINGLKHISLSDGTTIFEKDESSTEVYFILSGTTKSLNYGRKGNIGYFRLRHAGDCFGYYSAISELPRTATMITVGPTKLAKLSSPDFFTLILENPNVNRNFLKLIVGLLRVETDRLTHIITLPTHQRVAAELLMQSSTQNKAHVEIVNRDEFASYLGMTRETLSRALNHLHKNKLIKINKNHILILNPDSIKTFIET